MMWVWVELQDLKDSLQQWVWHVPVSLVCVVGAVVSGYDVPPELFLVLLLGFVGSYLLKKLTRPRFHDIEGIIEKMKRGNTLQAISAAQRLLQYVTDAQAGPEHQFILVRHHAAEVFLTRVTTTHPELRRLTLLLIGHCAQNPKNVYPLAREHLVPHVCRLLAYEDDTTVHAASFALIQFLKSKPPTVEKAIIFGTTAYKVP